uniref:Uncharacterized protein n=1 Tax=Aegilops tauschii TaxID=37682 RepID=M8BZ40_AEGTA
MAEAPSKIESMRKWVVDHKLRAVGCLWLSGISSSIAFNWSRPNMKTSVKLIHARLHAQALTIAALGSCALVEYYDQNYGSSGPKCSDVALDYLSRASFFLCEIANEQ